MSIPIRRSNTMRLCLLLALCASACTRSDLPLTETREVPLPIDSAFQQSPPTLAEWAYTRGISADLDGDGLTERVVVVAEVSLNEAGFPLWEDGHRWGVYAEAATGERTVMYAGFVPNGFVEAAVLQADSLGAASVLVLERSPGRLRTFEVRYSGAGTAAGVSSNEYQIGAWIPGSASLAND